MNKLSAVICSRQEIDYLLPFMRREINTCSNSNCKPIFELIEEEQAKAPLVRYQTKDSYKKSNKSALVQILIRLKYLRKTAFIIILSIGILPNLLRLIIPQKLLWLKYFIQKFGRN